MRRLYTRLKAWLQEQRSWLVANPTSMAIVAASLVAGLIVGWWPAEAGFDYAWRDPEMCDDCHVHDYANEAFFRSVHAGLTTCHDCHRVPIAHYPRNVVLTPFTSGDELDVVPHVDSVICSACHLAGHEGELSGPMTPEVLERVVKVDDSPLHKLHLEADLRDPGVGLGGAGEPHGEEAPHGSSHGGETRTITCMDCHGSESNRAHRFEAHRDNCLACHDGISESSGRLAALQCQECHFEGFTGAAP